ncbi:MAG: type II secretion system secretin GspD [Luminiphilus sp.]|nr:type II secretion system secretin GspD [Luminiphilus sp.]
MITRSVLVMLRRLGKSAPSLILSLCLSACATAPPANDSGQMAAGGASATPAKGDTAQIADVPIEAPDLSSEPAIFIGNDEGAKLPPARPPIRLDGEAVMLNFEQAPLNEVIHTILGDTLGLDYVIENQVPGEITLRTRSPIPRDQLLPILESLLRNNNVLMIRGPNDRFFISASGNIRSTVPSFTSEPGVGYSNVIVPLQYISANEMADILKPVARDDAFVRVDSGRNLLILAGTQLQLQGWLDIVTTFDVDQLAGKSVGIFPLANSTVEELFAELEHILATSGPADGVGGIASMVRVMPVERLNSIMVVSPRAHYIQTVQGWIEELDSIEDPASEPILQVYPVRNGNAGQLASLLSTIYGGGSGGVSSTGGVAPGMTEATSGGGSDGAGKRRSGGSGGGTFDLGDDVRVVSDDYNNSLLVYATPYEYQKIERILSKLDVVATQVLIEASIVEVTLTDDLQYGLEWAFDNNLGGGDSGRGLLDVGGNLQPQAGFSYTMTTETTKAVLNALAEDSLLNVISTPSVMVLDNHTAAINVGDQQPIQSQSTVTDGGTVQNSITYRDTGVQLTVTPSVNDGGLVTLDIEQSVTDVGPVDTATKQRSFNQRAVKSRVAIRSGESVVLGGLIRDSETERQSGVPVLKDIPLVGALFSTTNTTSVRTELLIFITPRVMESDQDLRDLNLEMRSRMRGLTNFEDLPVNFDPVTGD